MNVLCSQCLSMHVTFKVGDTDIVTVGTRYADCWVRIEGLPVSLLAHFVALLFASWLESCLLFWSIAFVLLGSTSSNEFKITRSEIWLKDIFVPLPWVWFPCSSSLRNNWPDILDSSMQITWLVHPCKTSRSWLQCLWKLVWSKTVRLEIWSQWLHTLLRTPSLEIRSTLKAFEVINFLQLWILNDDAWLWSDASYRGPSILQNAGCQAKQFSGDKESVDHHV